MIILKHYNTAIFVLKITNYSIIERQSQLRKHNVNDEATCKCNYIGPWKQNINTQ